MTKDTKIFPKDAPHRTGSQVDKANALIARVTAFERLHNEFDAARTTALFEDDAVVELAGIGWFQGADLHDLHEYDVALRATLSHRNFRVERDQVMCEVIERNDWLHRVGIEKIFYPSTTFTFSPAGKIKRVTGKLSAEDQAAISKVLAEFTPWLRRRRPEAATHLFNSQGKFIFGGASGTLVLELLAQWREDA